ncbi:MAG TPA: gliding motility-associated C-terminal domain-containing protein [Bacteroidales bacterium]|nr:gliding motility-associated C-terminal domain-containing protein [Bacteroidales bacterium]
MPVKTISGTPGTMVYIRIFGDQAKSGTFGICATDPLAPITGYSGPGGVGDSLSNELWVRADRGVARDDGQPATDGDNVKTWHDQSGNHVDIVQPSVINQAVLAANSVGVMPSLSFDGADDNYIREMGTLSAPLTVFAVSRFANVSKDESVLTLGDASPASMTSLSREADGRYYSLTGSKRYGPVINADENNIFEIKHSITSPFQQLLLNGSSQTVDDYTATLGTDGSLHIGSSGLMTGYFDGRLAEVIFFNKIVNKAQEIILNNYLAAKYGIDIGASDRYDYQATHQYDVAGIGRVDDENIHSKAQSDGILTIGGPTDLNDGEFLLFGHDDGSISSWSSVETPAADSNVMRLPREWRVDQSGGNGVGPVTLGLSTLKLPPLPEGFLAYNLLIDEDGDFSSGATAYGLVKSGDEYLTNTINLPDGAFITIIVVKPWVSFDNPASEGPESLDHPGFPVSLNYAISDPFEVSYQVVSGTATGNGIDYSLNPGSINFIPGQKTQDIVPLIIDDTLVEIPDEQFEVVLRNPTDGVLLAGDSLHTYTILDDDLDIDITATDTVTGYCRTSSARLYVSAAGQGPFTYSWSPADSLSDPVNDTTDVYPSATTTYTVTVTDKNGYSEQKSIMIYVKDAPNKPVITPQGTVDICAGDSVTLTADSAFLYVWSSGETTKTVTVKNAGSYTVYTVDEYGCESETSDPVNLQLTTVAKPVITALTDTVVCEGDTVKLESTTADSYIWSTGGNSRQVNLVNSGLVSLHVEDVNGCVSPESDPVQVTVNPLPAKAVIAPPGPLSICEGDTVELTITAAATSYDWSDGSTDASLRVTATGNYTVAVTDANGCTSPESDPVQVTVNPVPSKPEIDPAGPVSICEGDSARLTVTASAASYHWSDGSTAASLYAKTAGSYTVAVTDANGCVSPESDPVQVTVNPLPARAVIAPSGPLSICEGDTVELTTTAAATSYDWSNGSTGASLRVTATGNYTVAVTDANGCTSPESDPVQVTVNPLPSKPEIDPAGPVSICEGDSAQLTVTAPAASYQWSDGSTAASLYARTAGSYSVTVTDANGCTSAESAPVDVSVNPLPPRPQIDSSGVLAFCEGGSVELTATAAAGYLWSNGATTASVTVGETATLTVQVASAAGCFSAESDPVHVVVYPLPSTPVITPAGEVTIIKGDSIRLSASSAGSYIWSTGETSQSVNVKDEGSYTVRAISDQGCMSQPSEPVSVIVNDRLPKPVITLSGPTVICDGQSLQMTGPQAASYLWSTGAGTQTIAVDSPGSYTLVITNSDGIQSLESDPVVVTVYQNPEPRIETGDVSCFDGSDGSASVTITNGQSPYAFNWSDGSTTQTISGLPAGDLSVTVTDTHGCSGTATASIGQPGKLTISGAIIPASCPEAADGSIAVSASGGISPYGFAWNEDNYPGEEKMNLEPGTYAVTVTDANGCSAAESFVVGYDDELCLRIPEIITPNNDGLNDTWMIEGLGLFPDVVVEVYDRWGKRVFYSHGYNQPWDGTWNGIELPMESYHFVIDLKNGRQPVIGNITIVR